jgi:membrane-associated phospholipid phosphatase
MPLLTPSAQVWAFITRFGEAQILLPAMALMVVWLAAARAPRLAGIWIGCTVVAVVLTTLTKIAFLGWGLGYAPLDFTGISGHAMFAGAIVPVLMRCLAAAAPRPWQHAALGLGLAFAAGVAVSRVTTGAHSAFEAALGLALGFAASGLTIRLAPSPPAGFTAARHFLLAALAIWLAAGPATAPPPITHDLVTRLALAVSGHDRPYTRSQMMRAYCDRVARPPCGPWTGPRSAAPAGR